MSALLSVIDAHVAYGKVEAVRAASLMSAPRDRHRDRRQRRGQDHAAECDDGHAAAEGPRGFRRRGPGRGSRSRSASRAGLSLVPERRELFGTMTVEDNLQLGAFRIARAVAARSFERGLRAVSAPEGAAPATGRHAVGRRAADAGDGPRADGRAAAADAGRAEPGPRAAHRARDLPHHRRVARQPACRSCWSSRTRGPH